jgi:hypothetical protein
MDFHLTDLLNFLLEQKAAAEAMPNKVFIFVTKRDMQVLTPE